MAKAIAKYSGGITGLVEIAIRADGQVFRRYQNKGAYGYCWTAWKAGETVDVENLPGSFTAGFGNAYPVRDSYSDFKCRLPN